MTQFTPPFQGKNPTEHLELMTKVTKNKKSRDCHVNQDELTVES